jgi:hypothetical protein
VIGGRGDKQHRGKRGAEQRGEIHAFLEGRDLVEVLLERDREEEGEEDLGPGQGNPKLLQQIPEVAVEAGVFALFLPDGRSAVRSP